MPEDDRVSPTPAAGETADGSDELMAKVRRRIAAGRQALGVEPQLIDAVCGLREGTIARLEAGQCRIVPAHLFRLARLFSVGVDWFFADTEPLPAPASTRCSPQARADMLRFLAAYARLPSGRVRHEIRMLVGAVAHRTCDDPGTGLPLPLGELPPDR